MPPARRAADGEARSPCVCEGARVGVGAAVAWRGRRGAESRRGRRRAARREPALTVYRRSLFTGARCLPALTVYGAHCLLFYLNQLRYLLVVPRGAARAPPGRKRPIGGKRSGTGPPKPHCALQEILTGRFWKRGPEPRRFGTAARAAAGRAAYGCSAPGTPGVRVRARRRPCPVRPPVREVRYGTRQAMVWSVWCLVPCPRVAPALSRPAARPSRLPVGPLTARRARRVCV